MSLNDDLFSGLPAELAPSATPDLAGLAMPDSLADSDEPAPLATAPEDVVNQTRAALAGMEHSKLLALAMGDKETVASVMGTLRTAYQIRSAFLAHAVAQELSSRLQRMPTDVLLDTQKHLTQAAQFIPKEEKSQGGGFQLVINLSSGSPQAPIVLEAK